jgi:hypothetical protein
MGRRCRACLAPPAPPAPSPPDTSLETDLPALLASRVVAQALPAQAFLDLDLDRLSPG